MKKLLILLIGLSLTSVSFARGDRKLNKRTNKRQTRQHKRIKHGAQNGSLTRREGKRLVQGQRKIKKYKKHAKSDGNISKRERVKMERMQNKQSHKIFRAKHNDNSRDNVSSDKSFKGLNHRVGKRQKHQGKRIGQGLKSGELTKGETKRLVKGQKKKNKFKKNAKSDGEFTLKEKARLEKMQNKQSKRIYKTKHNDKSRGDSVADNSDIDNSNSELE